MRVVGIRDVASSLSVVLPPTDIVLVSGGRVALLLWYGFVVAATCSFLVVFKTATVGALVGRFVVGLVILEVGMLGRVGLVVRLLGGGCW